MKIIEKFNHIGSKLIKYWIFGSGITCFVLLTFGLVRATGELEVLGVIKEGSNPAWFFFFAGMFFIMGGIEIINWIKQRWVKKNE